MLVLSRGKDESIMVGRDVEVTVVDIRGNKVRIGITAPKSVPVHRREVYETIHGSREQKTTTDRGPSGK
jgi:carbon storage regulator